jgi:hypothetical protein
MACEKTEGLISKAHAELRTLTRDSPDGLIILTCGIAMLHMLEAIAREACAMNANINKLKPNA